MKQKIISILIGSLLGTMAALYGHSSTNEVTSGEPFSETQIQILQSEVNVPREIKSNKDEYTTIIPVKDPEYVYLEELPWDKEFQEFCQERCSYYKIGYAFFLAMAQSESSFIWPDTEENIGYMQINKVNIGRYEELDVYDPYDNVEIGIRMMAELKDQYCSFDEIVMGYKCGEATMLKLSEENIRLSSCDLIAEKTEYWQKLIEANRR